MNVLAVGAHPDDIELGCAATLVRHVAAGDRVSMLVMTTGDRGPQHTTSRVNEQEDAAGVIGAELLWGGFSDGTIPHGQETVNVIEEALRSSRADILYTHAPKDSHQDHVATATSALASARRLNRVLCFQSPSTTGFEPTVFVDVDRTMTAKVESLLAHRSQVLRCEMVDLEAVEANSRYWGHRARMLHAEAFETPRFAWDIGGFEMQAAERDPVDPGTIDNVVVPLRRSTGRSLASSE